MEELDIPGALERLKEAPGAYHYPLTPIERVLAGHTGTVQLLLSLLFNEPVDVVLIGQTEIESRREIHREVSLKLLDSKIEACRAVSIIDLNRNAPLVVAQIREGQLGLGQIAVKYNVPTARTINSIEVTRDKISREYTLESVGLGQEQQLHFTIMEMFPREVFTERMI